MKNSRFILPVVMLLAAAGCSQESTVEPQGTDSAAPDVVVDAGSDTAVTDLGSKDDTAALDVPQTKDAGADTVVDAGVDTVDDAGVADVPTDADDDVAPDVPPTPDVPAVQDTGPDTVVVDKISEHSNACSVPADCKIPCGQGVCNSGKCAYTPAPGTCLVPSGADKVACYGDGMVSAIAGCLSCNVEVSQTSLTAIASTLAVDSLNEGFEIKQISGGIDWSVSEKRARTGGKSLYFGDPATGNYANDKTVQAAVLTPALTVPGFPGAKPSVIFWLWLQTEEFAGYDMLSLAVVSADETKEIWNSDAIKGSSGNSWLPVEVDISAWAGKSVKFQFKFDSKDANSNNYEGAYVDDISLRTGCCGGVSDCEDGNPCSIDTCAPGEGGLPVCSQELKKNCCNSKADCDDGKPCTIDLCDKPGGTCTSSAKPGCCLTGDDCDDKDGCTIDHCPKPGAQCLHTNTCCQSDGECTSADPCLKGSCTGGDCTFVSTCCNTNDECDDFNPCTKDACTKSKCVHTPSLLPGCCSPEPHVNDWESDAEGWTSDPAVKGLTWHQYTFAGADKAKTGNGVWRMAIKGQDTFANVTGSNYVYAHSPEIKLPENQEYTLEFNVKFDITPKSSSHLLYAYIWHKNKIFSLGSMTPNTKGTDTDGWFTFSKNVSALAGQTFQIRLRGRIYGYGTSLANGPGILVDGLKFKTSCNPQKCTTHSDCPTVSTCQQGSCANGQCLYLNRCCTTLDDCGKSNLCYQPYKCQSTYCYFQENKSCCNDVGDCDDGNPCTADACPVPGELCKHDTVAACCLSAAQCNDGDDCTEDTCTANKCGHKNVCCKSSSDCDDKDDTCTEDSCVGGKCQWKQTNKPGCCTPLVAEYHFNDGGQGAGWTFQKCTPSVSYYSPVGCVNGSGAKPQKGWQVDPAALQKKSANGALYYGDPNAKNFNFGANAGVAMSPKIKIPQGKSQVEFWIYWDTETGTKYDKSAVFLFLDGVKQNVGSTGMPNSGALYYSGTGVYGSAKKWYHVKADTSAWAGKELQLQFYFNSGDSAVNSGQGIFVDDIKLTVDCGG